MASAPLGPRRIYSTNGRWVDRRDRVGLLRVLGGEVLDLVASSSTGSFTELAGTMRRRGGMRGEYARAEVRARIKSMATLDFWQTCLANCWKEFFSLICQNLWDSKCFSKLLLCLHDYVLASKANFIRAR
jgi:hypothetical protein